MTDTAYTYALTATAVIQRSDATFIPADPGNLDYAAYLAWVAAGGVATPYVAPPTPPLSATPCQLRLALNQQSLLTQAQAAVTASTNPEVAIAWDYAQVFYENDALLLSLAAGLNLSTAQIHSVFVLAQTLSP